MKKVVVVTGAARGMGRAHSLHLAGLGFHVCVCDLRDVGETLSEISQAGGSATGHQLDVTSQAAWNDLAAIDWNAMGQPFGLVNNAGLGGRASIMDETLAGWTDVMNVNLTGAFLGLKAMAPLFKAHGGGSVVNIGSAASLTGYRGAAYTASKWALRGLTRTAVGEFGPFGIRVNCIMPGLIDTPMAGSEPAFRASHVRSIPMERAGQADEVSAAVGFLLSEAASYINGAELTVDGGFISSAIYRRIFADANL